MTVITVIRSYRDELVCYSGGTQTDGLQCVGRSDVRNTAGNVHVPNVTVFVLEIRLQVLKGNTHRWRIYWASLSVAAGVLKCVLWNYGLLFLLRRLLTRSWKSANTEARILHMMESGSACATISSLCSRRSPGCAVMATGGAPARPRSRRGTALSGRPPCPCTSRRRPDRWGRWCRPRWSPARPPGPGGRSIPPGNRAGPGPTYRQLREFSWI